MGEMVRGPAENRLPLPVDRHPPSLPEGRRLPLPQAYRKREDTVINCQESSAGIYEVDEKGQAVVQFPIAQHRPGQIIDIWV
ncbi:MAG: hypothetical protein N2572_04680 [Syntrophales bacterium]|nr:hypothetical protein [Syntrophales bacterium]